MTRRLGTFLMGASALSVLLTAPVSWAQSPALDERWYENPLRFSPVSLHTRNGFILPALAVGAGLLLTDRDPALARRLTIYDEAGASWGYKSPHTTLWQDNLGVAFRARRWMSVGVEASFYSVRDDYNRTHGFAVRPFARFHPVSRDRWRLYFESGGGLVRFADEFPRPTPDDGRLGTQWNGTTEYGVGAEVDLGRRLTLHGGVRHVHVSNGNADGPERNPSHDSNGVFVGIGLRP